MLVGSPYSGKSTFCDRFLNDPNYRAAIIKVDDPNWVVLSTDAYIERICKDTGQKYVDLFKSQYKSAENNLKKSLIDAIDNHDNILWDQTNLTVKSRVRKLMKIHSRYHKTVIIFPRIDREELLRRMEKRSDKRISLSIIKMLENSYQTPTMEEGWEEIIEL